MKVITTKEYKQLFVKFLNAHEAYSKFEEHYLKQKAQNKDKNLLDLVINDFGAEYLIMMLTPTTKYPITNPNYWDKLSDQWTEYVRVWEMYKNLNLKRNIISITPK